MIFSIYIIGDKMKSFKIKEKKNTKAKKEPFDYYFGKPRIEMAGSECLVDGLEGIIEYSSTKIQVSLGTQIITFWGDDLRINSFTREGAVVEGNIMSMEFSS
ncbi:MAG: YabP/YqfC family sporulation protein [Eubacteriales bacterium]|nr:YabP/YqfC family sporulation protein [Eubacteriales bacterium]